MSFRDQIKAATEDVDAAYEELRKLDFLPEAAIRLVPAVLEHAYRRGTE